MNDALRLIAQKRDEERIRRIDIEQDILRDYPMPEELRGGEAHGQ